jgi:RNA polymerase sigma factor (sigma-70 family)
MVEVVESSLGTDGWLVQLRDRFVAVARRRLPSEAVEDVVQEALTVVYEKGIRVPQADAIDGMPPLAWCFQVLRNLIGNFYQKQRTRAATMSPDEDVERLDAADQSPTPLEALESREVRRLVRQALGELGKQDGTCAHYLQRLLEGLTPADLASEEAVEPAVLYRRVYRCRIKLRDILEQKGVLA